MLGFFVVVNALWYALHAYVAWRLLKPLAASSTRRRLLYALSVPPAVLTPLVFLVDRWLAPPFALAYRWVAWSYIGAFSTLFALLLVRDVLLLAVHGVDVLRARRGRAALLPASAARRDFLMNASSGVLVSATGALSAYGIREARKMPEVVSVQVPIHGLPRELDGYHIVQLSDMHIGETIDKDFILPIIEAVTSLSPDLVVLTGDLVDGSVDKLRADISPLGYLRARDGVLCVTGNHEYYSGVDDWCAHYRALGMTVLNNEHTLVERSGARLLIAGVTDLREGKNWAGHSSDPQRALAGAPAHDVRILLAHQPRSALVAQQHGFALQLSGHTHGGQFFPWNLVVGLVQPVGRGLAKIGNMWVYVNRGTCYWGPPLRSFVPAEITSLRLKRA
jgi:predicted MPP superfamily phosphohydrolase